MLLIYKIIYYNKKCDTIKIKIFSHRNVRKEWTAYLRYCKKIYYNLLNSVLLLNYLNVDLANPVRTKNG